MGGAMAAGFAYKNADSLAGLFFIGSYAAKMHAMPESNLPTLMIPGTHDFVTRKSEFDAQPERLPAHTIYAAIEGGDHYQFGSFKNVDVTATISRSEQQDQTVQALLGFLENLAS